MVRNQGEEVSEAIAAHRKDSGGRNSSEKFGWRGRVEGAKCFVFTAVPVGCAAFVLQLRQVGLLVGILLLPPRFKRAIDGDPADVPAVSTVVNLRGSIGQQTPCVDEPLGEVHHLQVLHAFRASEGIEASPSAVNQAGISEEGRRPEGTKKSMDGSVASTRNICGVRRKRDRLRRRARQCSMEGKSNVRTGPEAFPFANQRQSR